MQRSSSPQEETPSAGGPQGIEKYREVVQAYLEGKGGQTPLEGVLVETLGNGGKRIRPIVALLVCEAVAGSFERAIPIAAAFELAHSASLVQDDIIDESPTRHGREAAHQKYGTVRAILLSDLMLFEIFEELAKYGDSGLPTKRLGKLASLVGKSAKLTAEGEYLEMSLAEKGTVSEQEYLRLAELKTGSLFAACAACGAVVGGGTARQEQAAYEFGRMLGISFQIRDDILDIVGSAESTGKPLLKDLQNNASNMVLIHALAKADPYQKQAIHSMVYKKWFAPQEVDTLMRTLGELGSIDHSTEVEKAYALKAKLALQAFPESEAKRKLELLTEGLGARTK